MRKRTVNIIRGALFGLTLWLIPCAPAAVFEEGFEEASISPYWSKTGPGTAALTRSVAHSGSQSLQLTASSTYPWNVSVAHNYGAEQSGSVSIWVHSQLCCSASADLEILRSNGDWANVQQLASGGFQTRVGVGGVQSGQFFSGSAANWHLLEIEAESSGVTVKLDGVVVLTDPRIPSFQSVSLDVWGSPSAGSAYYDDFTAVTTPVVTDGFEGASISSFWTETGPGTASLSASIAHSGAQSVQLKTSSTYPYAASLSHDFGAEQSGAVSIWVHNTACCSSADIAIHRSNGDWVNIQQLSTGGFQTRVQVDGVQTGNYPSGSSAVWHLFTIEVDPTGVTVKLDGATVLSDPRITSFRSVALDVWGSPVGDAFFDDFAATL